MPRAAGGAWLSAVAAAALATHGCGGRDAEERAGSGEVRHGGVEYSARTALLASYPVRLRTTATATNHGREPVVLRFPDACPVRVRALTRSGELRWDQGDATMCAEVITEVRVAPGDSAVFETHVTAHEVLGDSLPDDVYLLVAYLHPEGREPVVLQAGRANLVVPR
jgi:hypothetical protein